MSREQRTGLKKVVHDIRKEAMRQIRGSREELGRQLTSGWGNELAHQIFGVTRRHERRSR
jgi:hypothetical protein